MTKEIVIGGIPVKFAGNAATTYRYRQLFKLDMLRLFMEKGTDLDIDRIIELAYVMHLQAEGYTTEQFNAETTDDYIAWLERFDFTELLQRAPEILGVWVDTSKQQSKSKKKFARLKES
jgi:hypothetical protein